MSRKIKKFKNRFPDHDDAIISIHSPDGYNGVIIYTASQDGSIFCNIFLLHLEVI